MGCADWGTVAATAEFQALGTAARDCWQTCDTWLDKLRRLPCSSVRFSAFRVGRVSIRSSCLAGPQQFGTGFDSWHIGADSLTRALQLGAHSFFSAVCLRDRFRQAAILMSAEPAACAAEQLRPLLALQGRLFSPQPWFNMSLQGVQPLRQQASQAGAAAAQAWQLHQPGRAGARTAAGLWQPWLQAQVSDETAFEGGSCLRLQGEGVAPNPSMSTLLCCCMAGA